MVLASLAEVISIGAVIPFLGVITVPEQIYQHHFMQPVVQLLQLTNPQQLLLPITITFIIAALLAGTLRLLLLYVTIRLSFATGADLSINIYRRTLYQEYITHVARNSSEIINSIITKTNTVTGSIINPLLTLISSSVLIAAILITLLFIDITVAIAAFVGFGSLYLGVIRYTNKRVKENGQCIAEQSTQMIKSLQEGLGGIRDVIIDGSQQFYCRIYRSADLPLRKAHGNNTFISGSPRYVMEAIGITLIAGLAYIMSLREDGLVTAIPILGALALGAQRLLPILQQAYHAYSSIKGSYPSFCDVLELLDQPLPNYINQPLPSPIHFEKDIQLTNLSFRYNNNIPWVLEEINLNISKGSRVGFIGVTGSGKSTLLDIIMGLLSPTKGQFLVDNKQITKENLRAWQMRIAHVPQNIYLSDSTIEENIAFGVPKEQIDHEQVIKAAEQAQIKELIEEWPQQYQTFVGERGIRLSGGQRQRIGIARAMYKHADVLIFDEATSALDNETEQAVMSAIDGLGKDLTILIIAHRLTTLKGCDQIVEVARADVKIGTYNELQNTSNREEEKI